MTTTLVDNQAYTTTPPGYVNTVIKPGQDVYVRVLKLAPGQQVPGTYSADQIIRFVGPRERRG